MTKIRTRYAPSPTGRMHVGNLRTALYAYLIAKHEGGDFLLRIEDTDQERFVEGATEIIYRTLEETGLVHDEGPDKDGGVGLLALTLYIWANTTVFIRALMYRVSARKQAFTWSMRKN